LLGNPVIWWGNLVLLGLFCAVLAWQLLLQQRQPQHDALQSKKLTTCVWLLVGWWLHFAPFWVMGRVLYFHHYFPALMFSSMLSGNFAYRVVF
jgi:dolichyl-phosphate-mannose-protein mannosyltransferase